MSSSNWQESEGSLALLDIAVEPVAQVPRAPRFPIEAPVQYRLMGEQDWREGIAVNISRTGILFRSEADLPPQTMIEVRILFPVELTGECAASVFCKGTILRRESNGSVHGRTAVAAAISHYRFRQESGEFVRTPTRWRSVSPHL
jgi:hypothetical protein